MTVAELANQIFFEANLQVGELPLQNQFCNAWKRATQVLYNSPLTAQLERPFPAPACGAIFDDERMIPAQLRPSDVLRPLIKGELYEHEQWKGLGPETAKETELARGIVDKAPIPKMKPIQVRRPEDIATETDAI